MPYSQSALITFLSNWGILRSLKWHFWILKIMVMTSITQNTTLLHCTNGASYKTLHIGYLRNVITVAHLEHMGSWHTQQNFSLTLISNVFAFVTLTYSWFCVASCKITSWMRNWFYGDINTDMKVFKEKCSQTPEKSNICSKIHLLCVSVNTWTA